MRLDLVPILRDAARQTRRQPLSALFIALTMAIGVAAATAVFTVARGVVLRPLPYRDPAALIAIHEYQASPATEQTAVAFANVARYGGARSLANVTAFAYGEFVLSGESDAERVIGASVDGDLFATLGVRPLHGRGISSNDVGERPARVVVLAFALWKRRFGGDPRIVGRSIVIDGVPSTVVGVTDEAFEFPRSPLMDRDVEILVPRRPPAPMMIRRGMRDLTVVARLAPHVGRTRAGEEIAAISQRAEAEDPQVNGGWRARTVGLRDIVVGRVRPAIAMLSVCVAVLLLVACVNAAAGVLARVTMRRDAYWIRLSLGAELRHIVALVAGEVGLLAMLAVAIALPLGVVIRGLLVHAAPVAVPRQRWIVVDGVALAFMTGVALFTATAAMIGPVAWLRRIDLTASLAGGSRTLAGSPMRGRSVATFIGVQAALATALLVLTLALYSTFLRVNRADPGFAAEHVWTATIPLRGMRYRDAEARSRLTTRLLDEVRAIPGVERAAVGSLMPLSGGLMSGSYHVDDASSDTAATAALRAVSPDFFRTLGIPLLHGRPIEAGDDASSVRVVVVNQAFVSQALGSRSAIGATVSLTPPGSESAQSFVIVGVTGNAKEKDLLGPDTPIVYFSDRQASFPHTVLVVRSRGALPPRPIRRALRELDPSLALDDVTPLAERVRSAYGLQFFLLYVLGVFASSTLVLIAVGVFGSVSHVVDSNLRAVAVRLALGATPSAVMVSLLERTTVLTCVGCVIGVALALAVAGITAVAGLSIDLTGVALSVATLVFVALAATWPSALRAGRSDPLSTLRS